MKPSLLTFTALAAGALLSAATWATNHDRAPPDNMPAVLHSDPGFDRAKSDKAAATPFACSARTLREGRPCVLTTSPPVTGAAAHASESAARLSEMAVDLCRRAGARDADLRSACLRLFGSALEGACAQAPQTSAPPLLDDNDRFTQAGGECYREMHEALADAQRLATDHATCCRCTVAACGGELSACYDVIAGGPGALDATCLAKRCPTPCAAALLAPPPALRALEPTPKGGAR